MIIFSIFFKISYSTWWNFSESEFPNKVAHSFEKPIFQLCYSRYCPHCVGLPEGFRNFNRTLGDRDDIYISMIDCAVERGCWLFKIHGTPSIKLVMGNNVRYWADTGERGANGWSRFIDSHIGPNLRQIYNDSELEEAKNEPTDGGTTFYLETPSINHSWVNEVRLLSREFRIYNDIFVFRVDESLLFPKLHAFRSKYCDKVYTGFKAGIRHFINKNKFGVLHRYDLNEFEKLVQTRKAALFIVNKNIMLEHKNGLIELSKDHCNEDIDFGWASIGEKNDDQKINKYVKADLNELPFLFTINIHGNSNNKYKGRIADATKFGFLPHLKTVSQKMKENYEFAFIYIATAVLWGIVLLYFISFLLFNDNQSNVSSPLTKLS